MRAQLLLALTLALGFTAQAQEEFTERSHSTGGFGVILSGYYDPITSYNKMVTSAANGEFGYNTGTGLGGMQVLVTYSLPSHFELATGFDYFFPQNLQGQQNFTGQKALNSQTLNIWGVKVLQVGYQLQWNQFALTPYAGLGLYYGKDVAQLTTLVNQTDQVTYSKYMGVFAAGTRAEFIFGDNPRISLGGALELFQPFNLATDLAQSGTATSELPGVEPNLQSSMEFMTATGFRIMAQAGITFR